MQFFAQLLLAFPCSLPMPQEALPTAAAGAEPRVATSAALLIDRIMQAAIQEEGAVGLSVGVSLGDKLLYSGGYGKAELEHDVPVNKDTMFRIGSITKQFTAAAICQLAEQDQLFIDDSLARFVPDFDTKGREITLRQLMTHTSGIFNYTNLGESWIKTTPLDLSRRELLDLVSEKPLEFEPGAAFRYSNTGYYLLGMVIEAASGSTYAEYIEQHFQKQLGLSRTRYGSNQELIPNRAQGYRYLGEGKFGNDLLLSMEQPYAAGSLLSTGEDLVRWSMALVAGKVVSPESFEEMSMPFMLNDGNESEYGFGLSVADFQGKAAYSHGGGIFGFNSMMYYFPETGLCVAVISNSEGYSAGELAAKLVGALME